MHDPMTVAFEIKWPFFKTHRLGSKPWRYWPPFITIWHVDPESDGSDDSCGWSWAKRSEADRDLVRRIATEEFEYWTGRHSAFAHGGQHFSSHDMIWWAWWIIAARRHKKSVVLSRREEQRIRMLSANPHDNIRSLATQTGSIDGLESFLNCVDRLYRTHHRPWWKHPRWHVWHWHVQVHPWQTFRRWAFSRCAGCGKRFTWGYCPTSVMWDKPRPRWFRSEIGSYHSECAPNGAQASGVKSSMSEPR